MFSFLHVSFPVWSLQDGIWRHALVHIHPHPLKNDDSLLSYRARLRKEYDLGSPLEVSEHMTSEMTRSPRLDIRVPFAGGRFLTPLLRDAHLHLSFAVQFAGYIDVSACSNWNQVCDRIRLEAKSAPETREVFVAARGLSPTLMDIQDTTLPSFRDILDTVDSERPVVVFCSDLHSAVVNSRALLTLSPSVRLSSCETIPEGGQDVNAHEVNAFTGVVREIGVHHLASNLSTLLGQRMTDKGIAALEEQCFKNGIRTVYSTEDFDGVHELVRAARSGKLHLQVEYWYGHGGDVEKYIAYLEAARKMTVDPSPETLDLLQRYPYHQQHCDSVSLTGFKIFLDGSLRSRTAALRLPYACSEEDGKSRKETSGVLFYDDAHLVRLCQRIHDLGYPCVFHAIGDAAMAQAIRVLSSLPEVQGKPDRIEHAQLASNADLDDLKLLRSRVILGMQPSHMIDDADYALPLLGMHRFHMLYRIREFMDAGIRVQFGSDAPVEQITVWRNLQASTALPFCSTTLNQAISWMRALAASSESDSLEGILPWEHVIPEVVVVEGCILFAKDSSLVGMVVTMEDQ